MIVVLNGAEVEVPEGLSVGELVRVSGAPAQGVAVAVDGQVVPASHWGDGLRGGSVVEVLTAVQGG